MVRLKVRAQRAVAVLLVTLLMTGGVSQAESLQDAWNIAITANQGLQAAQTGTAAARRSLDSAKAERVPTLTTLNAYTWLNNTPTFKSTLRLPGSPAPLNISFPFLNREFFFSSTLMNVPLYSGGRIMAGIDAGASQAGAAHAEEVTALMDLKLDVAQAYLSVLRSEKLLLLARTSVTSLQAHERDVNNLFKEGVAKRTDLLSSQVSLARARQRVIQASNECQVARASYNRLLGRSLIAPTQLEEMALRTDADPGGDDRQTHLDSLPEACRMPVL